MPLSMYYETKGILVSNGIVIVDVFIICGQRLIRKVLINLRMIGKGITVEQGRIISLANFISTKDDPSIIRLTVQNKDPEVAARIANLWADQFVVLSNDIYGEGGQEQVDFFEEQQALAGSDMALAEDARLLIKV